MSSSLRSFKKTVWSDLIFYSTLLLLGVGRSTASESGESSPSQLPSPLYIDDIEPYQPGYEGSSEGSEMDNRNLHAKVAKCITYM